MTFSQFPFFTGSSFHHTFPYHRTHFLFPFPSPPLYCIPKFFWGSPYPSLLSLAPLCLFFLSFHFFPSVSPTFFPHFSVSPCTSQWKSSVLFSLLLTHHHPHNHHYQHHCHPRFTIYAFPHFSPSPSRQIPLPFQVFRLFLRLFPATLSWSAQGFKQRGSIRQKRGRIYE